MTSTPCGGTFTASLCPTNPDSNELQAPQENVDDTLPCILPRRALGGDAKVASAIRVLHQVRHVSDDLIGILGLDRNRVLKRLGVVLARRSDEGHPAGCHGLQPNQAERFVAAVSQGGGGRGV